MPPSFSTNPVVVFFSAIVICTQATSALTFLPVVFPFADLHPTAGAHYTAEVLHLLGPTPPDETDLSMTNVSSHAFCLPGSILFPP
jgi:hypothetical protein